MRRLPAAHADRLRYEPVLADPHLLGALDGWENRWFPIAEVVLRMHYPKTHAVVFRNLRQTDGPEVVVSVSTLLDRIDAIARPESEGGSGDEGVAARALLEKRGVTERVVTEAREILAQIGSLTEIPLTPDPETPKRPRPPRSRSGAGTSSGAASRASPSATAACSAGSDSSARSRRPTAQRRTWS